MPYNGSLSVFIPNRPFYNSWATQDAGTKQPLPRTRMTTYRTPGRAETFRTTPENQLVGEAHEVLSARVPRIVVRRQHAIVGI